MPLTPEPGARAFLVRHGRSTFNTSAMYQGCCDQPELTEQGRQEARLAARKLAREEIGLVVSSPLRRALDTAREMLAEFQRQGARVPDLRIEGRLKEIDLSEWEGLPFAEVRERFPQHHAMFRSQPHLFCSGAFYPVLDLFERARLFWKELPWRKRVLIVTHGGTLSALIGTALGIGPERFHSLQQSHGAISVMESATRLAMFNSVSHLGKRLPKTKSGRTGLRLLLAAGDAGGDSCLREKLREMIARVAGRPLTTVRAIVPEREWAATLAEFLLLDEPTAARFQPRAQDVTVIHYPGNGSAPVLQGFNLPAGGGA